MASLTSQLSRVVFLKQLLSSLKIVFDSYQRCGRDVQVKTWTEDMLFLFFIWYCCYDLFLLLLFLFFATPHSCRILGSIPTRDWRWTTAVKAPSPNHRATREFPCCCFIYLCIYLFFCMLEALLRCLGIFGWLLMIRIKRKISLRMVYVELASLWLELGGCSVTSWSVNILIYLLDICLFIFGCVGPQLQPVRSSVVARRLKGSFLQTVTFSSHHSLWFLCIVVIF